MSELPLSRTAMQEQLAYLRARVQRVNEKYADRPAALPEPGEDPEFSTRPPRPAARYIEEWLTGSEVETEYGRHFETEKLWEPHRRHGSADIGALADLPHDLLETISDGVCPNASPEEWAFLDTETTGLAGGSGTCAFLIGVGRVTREGFYVKQFFMRDHAEEASQLAALARHLESFKILITYNGRTFDQPLLETRYRLNRARPPFARMEHLDLLHGARRLWKLRFESCRLVDLENQILGIERQGDVPGALIPYLYFEYLRTRQAARMLPVFHHNAFDIVTLACLTGIVPYAFKDPHNGPLHHGAEIAGIGRWLREAGELDQARILFRRAIGKGLPDRLLFKVLWDLAQLERKLGAEDAAMAIWTDLAGSPNPFRVEALVELAKMHEHCTKNLTLALEMTRTALELEDSVALRKREDRLARRTASSRPAKREPAQKRRSTAKSR
jgi:uncharacterized protein YprB with RNaseH-like and TPR domain